MVLNEVRAKYVLGLTATPDRQDGHQKIIFMAAGPIRHKVKSQTDEQFEQEVRVHQLQYTERHALLTEERPKVTDVYRMIMENEARTNRIVVDVLQSVTESRHPLVTIHDYVDSDIPMLQRMFAKREKSYKAMGYKMEVVVECDITCTALV